MKHLKKLLFALMLLATKAIAAPPTAHTWEMQELSFTAKNHYNNPYTDVTVWIDLSGPGFTKKVYGYWDGDSTFRVRIVATNPGLWSWKSNSSSNDPGLVGKTGSFTAIEWTEEQRTENATRRGFLRPSPNNHALNYADGTPYFAIGDTWFALAAGHRFKWYDDSLQRSIGPGAGFKDYVRYRKAQGYNWINVIAAFPNWKTDDKPWRILLNDSAKTTLRSAWVEYGTGSAKNMSNEGGDPFLYPGKVPGFENYFPDIDRINPEYFKYLDRKIAYLNANGFIPFIEVSRRDAGPLWSKYYKWPDSYSLFIQYIYSRYQAYNSVLSPIHMDIIRETISPEEYLAAISLTEKKYGSLPFENLHSANSNPSTLTNWGDSSWVTLHQIGNTRVHDGYWYLTEIFHSKHPRPALNGEPYYAGYKDARGGGGANFMAGGIGGTDHDNSLVRSGMYGSVLSGGLAGHVYGAEGIWGGDVEQDAPVHLWDAFRWKSGAEMQYLKTFVFSIGNRYQELVPMSDLVSPNRNSTIYSFDGWAYCARTPDRNIILAYFEKSCPQSMIRGARLNSFYSARWFNPRNGSWLTIGEGKIAASNVGIINVPKPPDDMDWGLQLIFLGPNEKDKILPTPIAENKSALERIISKPYGIPAIVISILVALVGVLLTGARSKYLKASPVIKTVFWIGLLIGLPAYIIGLQKSEMLVSEKGFYLAVLALGIISTLSIQKILTDKRRGNKLTAIYMVASTLCLLLSVALFSVLVINSNYERTEKGFYAACFILSLMSAIALQIVGNRKLTK